jgi:hypothetical protein
LVRKAILSRKAPPPLCCAPETHNIVIIAEIHSNKQEYDWFNSPVATPEFADQVDDIVLEMGNSLYQKSVDRYVGGEDIP